MATSIDPSSSTPTADYPLHWLNVPQTRAWLIVPVIRKQLAEALVRERYPGGCGILSATCRLIALVNPLGGVRDLPAPHHRYPIWAIANKPKAVECPCAAFFDPESGGPWRDRQEKDHHPLCQYDKTSAAVFKEAEELAQSRVARGLSPQASPDEWTRLREKHRNR